MVANTTRSVLAHKSARWWTQSWRVSLADKLRPWMYFQGHVPVKRFHVQFHAARHLFQTHFADPLAIQAGCSLLQFALILSLILP